MKWIKFCMIALGCMIFAGCSAQEIVNPSDLSSNQTAIDGSPSEHNGSPCLISSLIYEREMTEKVVLPPSWLNGELVSWVSKADNMGGTSYQVHIINVKEGNENIVYKKEIEDGRDPDVNIAFSNDTNTICIYFFDSTTSRLDKIVLDIENGEIISENTFEYPYQVSLNGRSTQDIIIAKDIHAEQSGTFNWNIVLFPLEGSEQTYHLKQSDGVRYDFSNSIWSLSGEYFYLLNHDANGMNRFESLVDLFAYPKTEWPTKLQYDVFHKDGSFAFSFTVDLIYHDDGSDNSHNIFWIPGDQIFITSIFYHAKSDSYDAKEQLIDASGEVIGEWFYDGYRDQYLSCEFDAEGVYYGERKSDSTHLLYKYFNRDEVIDYGPVQDLTEETFILPNPDPDSKFFLLTDRKQTLRIIEFV